MEFTDIDHDLLPVDEFDALTIEVKIPGQSTRDSDAPKPKFPGKQHARKVAKELGAKEGIIYLPGQVEQNWEDSDQTLPFRQRRYFYYLTGADFPGCAATYDIGADRLSLWIPYTPPATILWFGNTPSAEDCLARSDVDRVKYVQDLPAYLTARLEAVRRLYVLRQSQLPRFDRFDDGLKRGLAIDMVALQPAMDRARVVKTDYEVAMIRRANDVSSAAHRRVLDRLASYANECEVEAAFVAACTARGARRQAYPVIAGAGPNASTLHYEDNDQPLAGPDRQTLVLDAGAEWDCYASDVTRTLPLNGPTFTPEAQAIYDLVYRMQSECIARLRPGVVFRELQLHATRVAVEGLLALGILRGGSADEIYRNGTGAAFFPHGLGHHVGLDVHDVLSPELLRPVGEGMWGKRRPIGPQTMRAMIRQAEGAKAGGRGSSKSTSNPTTTTTTTTSRPPPAAAAATTPTTTASPGSTAPSKTPPAAASPAPLDPHVLQPGMVVTVEPGLYFCRPYVEAYFLGSDDHARYLDRAALDRYWAVGGVRIEDCVLVTRTGCENLTSAPKFGKPSSSHSSHP